MKPAISLVGAGAAGSALLLALHRQGYPVAAVSSRSLGSAQRCADLVACANATTDNPEAARRGEIVIIATPDRVIGEVCAALARNGAVRPGQLVLHLSGALDAGELRPAADAGADTCALHPIQTLVEPIKGAELLRSAWFCLEGNPAGIVRARELADALSGCVFTLDAARKAHYHAALCVSSNYLITVENMAVDMLVEAGLERRVALQALLPLIHGAAENLARSGLPDALTGPISRGDSATIEKHLRALREQNSRHTELYLHLGMAALELARGQGRLSQQQQEELRRLLKL